VAQEPFAPVEELESADGAGLPGLGKGAMLMF
jgi:hypothetical protein